MTTTDTRWSRGPDATSVRSPYILDRSKHYGPDHIGKWQPPWERVPYVDHMASGRRSLYLREPRMPTHRRLTAAFSAFALGWVGVAVLVAPGAEADPGNRAPHDPATYYAGTEGLSGQALATKLNTIIDGHTQLSYGGVYDALPFTDEDPANSDNLIVFYSGTSLDKDSRCGAGSCAGLWNREHSWPQSHGGIGTSGPGADLFHMRPEFADTNSSRGNKDFDNGGTADVPSCAPCLSTSISFEPRAAVKGDLARGLFYMAVRYNGDADDGFGLDLAMAENIPTSGPFLGRLSTLAAWSLADPPDDLERARNNLIDGTYQHNRNPFIDHPEWVCSIWAGQVPAALCATDNHAPTTAPMTKTTLEDTATTVALTANDVDGDTLTWSITGAPAHGAANITGGSTLTYAPAANYNGTDVVGVTVSDDKGGAAATTVTFTVNPVNDPPTATAQNISTPQNTAKVVTLTATDVEGDPLTYALGTQPAHGNVSIAGDQATYTPAGGYSGPDSFTFAASDGALTSAPATVSINITAAVNHAPTATAQSTSTPEDTAKVITLVGSDSDGDTLTFAKANDPAHGTVTITSSGSATYTPAANYTGADSFTFTVSDGALTSAAATVTINVTPVNDGPTVTGTLLRTTAGTPVSATLGNSDPDGDSVTITTATSPAHGSVTSSGATVTYTPAIRSGTDSFLVTVSDGHGGTAQAQVGVEITALTAQLQLSTPSATRGTAVATTITATGPSGAIPAGSVTLSNGGTTLGTATIRPDGTASVPWTPALAGATSLVASYAGDARFAPASSGSVPVTVARATAKLKISGSVRSGRPGVVTVKVLTVAGLPATGKVTLEVGSTRLTAKVKNGVARLRIPEVPGNARLKVKASYSGDGQYAAASAKHSFQLRT